ncbi:MAG: hypothetical protein ACR2G0_13500 [Chthoniobacterales bacterium]
MLRHPSTWLCLLLGLFLTVVQVALAVGFAHPAGSLRDRYLTLIQHDSYWFANIIDRGYGTTVPPIDHKEMEVSNVAFFPAYPLLAYGVKKITGLGTYPALLLTAQAATWGFWSYFFLFCGRWELSPVLQAFGALTIVAHPAAFYFVAGYSESLFLMSLVGFIYWSTSERRGAKWLAALHGFSMSATRIVGLPCAAFPVIQAFFKNGLGLRWKLRDWWLAFRWPVLVMLASMLGGLAFFAYCQVRWGRWDLYMLTQAAGWSIAADYLAALKPANFNFALPSIHEPTRASQFTSAIAGLLFVAIALLELIAALRRRNGDWRKRIGIYFAAVVIYYVSVAGVASVQLESMLRYDLCVHGLVVLGLLHFLRKFRLPPVLVRAFAMGLAALACAAGIGLQGFYVWNFTQGNWVA